MVSLVPPASHPGAGGFKTIKAPAKQGSTEKDATEHSEASEMSPMRFLVTGAAGQLGAVIVERFSAFGEVTAMTRTDLDISCESDVLRAAGQARPDVIINCSAYNQVDLAEEQAPQALAVNAFGVLALARAANENDAVLIHYSTDFVFDGEIDRPYMTWGGAGDIPVPGDYDLDGKTDIAIFRPATGTWFIANSGGGSSAFVFGGAGDIPIIK